MGKASYFMLAILITLSPSLGLIFESRGMMAIASPLTVMVTKIEVLGNTILTPEELKAIVAPLEGKNVTLEELKNLSDQITEAYIDKGYITSAAILVDREITDGVVILQTIESRISEIKIIGSSRLASYIRNRIAYTLTEPFQVSRLESAIALLEKDPLIKRINANIITGTNPGEVSIEVEVEETKALQGTVYTDNYSPVAVGSERLGMQLTYANLTGLGDWLDLAYTRSTTGGVEFWNVGYRVPINAQNGTLSLRIVQDNYRLTQEPFKALNINGNSELYEVSFRQPLIRSTQEELALSLTFTHREGQTFLFNNIPQPFGFGAAADGSTRTSIIRFGQEYWRRDQGGIWLARSQFSFGVPWLNATLNNTPIPDSRFLSWSGQLQRLFDWGSDYSLIVNANWQLSFDSLLASEQFVIGGGQSLRGYRQSARSGDNGVLISAEMRYTVEKDKDNTPIFQIAPYVDLGMVWNYPHNPNFLPEETFLADVGVGFLWRIFPQTQLRLDYAVPLVSTSDRGKNAQDLAIYFQLLHSF